MLSVIEKVILLQNVDVFSEVPSEQLAHLATIAEEVEFSSDECIYADDEPSDAMYVVLGGSVRLHRGQTVITVAKTNDAFGTWALFDDAPRVVAATALETTRLLRVDKEDFIEVLADNVAVTQAVLKTIARRLRALGRAIGTRETPMEPGKYAEHDG